MRIVGGSLRGRRLAVPGSQNIRPTTDRVRESLFNILQHGYADDLMGANVLDAFAGTGALGIEALSRGAAAVTCVEKSAEGAGLIRQNIEALGIAGAATVIRADATRLGQRHTPRPFGLVFADPPYGKALAERALAGLREGGWLADGALAVVEEERDALPERVDGFERLENRMFGGTQVAFFRLK